AVRFDQPPWLLAPSSSPRAPVRDAGLTRDAAIEYAEERSLPVPVTKSSPYSIDENLWGRTMECGIIEDPWVSPPQDAYEWTVSPENAPDEPDVLTISFESGNPVTIDVGGGSAADLIAQADRRAGPHGIGRFARI